MAVKLDIKKTLVSVDLKDYNFYENLTDEEKKAFSPFVLMRYTSGAQASSDVQAWFIEQTNEAVNKNHWSLSKDHKALLWKLFATVGAGTKCYHPYIAAGKKEKVNKIGKLLAELNPSMKLEDINLWASFITEEEKEEMFDKLGFDKTQRKEYE